MGFYLSWLSANDPMSGLILGKQAFRTISLSQLDVIYTENSNSLFSKQYPWNIREFTKVKLEHAPCVACREKTFYIFSANKRKLNVWSMKLLWHMRRKFTDVVEQFKWVSE